MKSILTLVAVVALSLPLPLASLRAALAGGETGADLVVDVGTVSDPGSGSHLSFSLANYGPDEATNVALQIAVPDGARLGTFSIDQPSHVATPGNGNPGDLVFHFAKLPVGFLVLVEINLDLPNEPGWSAPTTASVTADQPDPNVDNNTLTLSASVPIPPVIERIRFLENPVRLEIAGSGLNLTPFGGVLIGCYDEFFAPVLENTDTRIVVGGGRELKRHLPRKHVVPIQIWTPNGARVTVPYTRP